MPSLGIAPHPGGCVGQPTKLTQDEAPVTGVFPADATLRLLEDFRQSSFRPIARVPQRTAPYAWARPLISWHALVPSSLSASGKPSDPGTSLQVPPSCAGIRQGASRRTRSRRRTSDRQASGERTGRRQPATDEPLHPPVDRHVVDVDPAF